MGLKLPPPVRNLLKSTNFWRENGLVVTELKNLRKLTISAMFFTLVGAFLEGITVGLIASFLQGLTTPNDPPIKIGIEWFDVWVLATNAPGGERIYRLAIIVLLAIWLRATFTYLGQYYFILTEARLTDRFRQRVFDQLQSLTLSYFSAARSGELVNSMTTEVNQTRLAFRMLFALITRFSTLIAYIISIFLLSWQLATAAVATFLLLSLTLSRVTAMVREASFAVPKANGNFTSVSLEFVNGIRTIHASSTLNYERRRFYQASKQVRTAYTKVDTLSALVQPLVQAVCSTLLIAIVILAFTAFVSSGQLPAASLITFLFALSRMAPLLSQVNQAKTRLSSYQGALSNVNDLLKPQGKPFFENGSLLFSGLEHSIDFVGVNFAYDPEEDLVLKKINLSLKKGQTTALVGASGAGKTTLVDLIPRFYEPSKGKILIDGIDVRRFDVNSLRYKMAIVSQDTFIFNASVRDNITYGVKIADNETIEEAASQANALEFILDLPEGFDTQLGDRGVRLSGGQRQRIAIARALLRNPEILVLDEATSALDSVTEKLIQESLEKLSRGRTVIAIAHRLSTIVKADQVVVLDKGIVVEQGNYQELLAKQGKLWKYHQMQYQSANVG